MPLARRDFLRRSAGAAAFSILPASARGANARVQVAAIGVAGKGHTDILATAAAGAEVVALCDVADPRRAELGRRKKAKAGAAGETILDRFPGARFFTDYRQMLTAHPGIDAVVVSTPDHHHFHASLLAIRRGKHVYCQKPIAHSVWEARRLAEAAAAAGVRTQMGNQAHAGEPIRRAVELIRAGLLGRVTEVHAWTNRPIWPQGMERWPAAEPVPAGLDWEQWIGPAPFRDYSRAIAPFNWRGYWDFGAGALGDMGCHILDLPYWALDLGAPDRVEAVAEGATAIAAPHWSRVTYRFPSSVLGGPVTVVWHDGVTPREGVYRNPPPEHLWRADFPSADHVFRRFDLVLVGERGRMFFGRSRQDWVFRPESLGAGVATVPRTLPRVRGSGASAEGAMAGEGGPYVEWLDAIRGGRPALAEFAQSGPFSEMVLLGNVALRAGGRIDWDARALRVTNRPDAAGLVRRAYRRGWELE